MEKKVIPVEENYIFPFGMHAGKKIKDIPANYLLWLYDQGGPSGYPEIREYIKQNKIILHTSKLTSRYSQIK